MKKTFTLSLAVALAASIYADEVKTFSFGMGTPGVDEPTFCGLGLSGNGKYFCGAFDQGIGIVIGNTETGELKYKMCGDSGGELRHINNNGIAVGMDSSEEIADYGMTYSFANDETDILMPPAGVKYIMGEGITDDNKIIAGTLITPTATKAAYQVDGGEWIYLPYPSEEEIGSLASILHKGEWSGINNISSDGSIIYGYIGNFVLPCLWVRNAQGGYDCDFFAGKYIKKVEADRDNPEKPLYSMSAYYGLSLSNDGRYACMIGLMMNEKEEYFSVPCVYDTANKTLKVYEGIQEIDVNGDGLYPMGISNYGTIIGSIGKPYFGSTGCFIWRAGEDAPQKFSEAFPNFYEKLGAGEDIGLNMPTGISADGSKILGYIWATQDDFSNTGYWLTYLIERDDLSGVNEIAAEEGEAVVQGIYSIDGKKLNTLQKGINIVRMSDGSARKILK